MIRKLHYGVATLLLGLPSILLSNPVAQVADAVQNATVERAGQRFYVETGQSIDLGDVISTGATGQVQLLFEDDTKIVMSANSQLEITNILFNSASTASEFAVDAVGGAFRFLSGDSEKSAYSIRTPNATMGIRGTVFDFSLDQQGSISLVTFEGEVDLCSSANQCAQVRGGCAAVNLNNNGEFFIPETADEKSELLSNGFPYIFEQDNLLRAFQTQTRSCGGQSAQIFSPDRGSDRERIVQPLPPRTGGAQTGNDTSAGRGGSTADGVNAGRGGTTGTGNANAGSGGASAGGGVSSGDGGASVGGN